MFEPQYNVVEQKLCFTVSEVGSSVCFSSKACLHLLFCMIITEVNIKVHHIKVLIQNVFLVTLFFTSAYSFVTYRCH